MNCLIALSITGGVALLAACSHKDPIVARVGGQPITLQEFQSKLYQAPERFQVQLQSEQGQRQFVDIILREKLLFVLAQQRGLLRDTEVKQALADFRQDQSRQLAEFRESILVSKLFEELRGKELTVSDAEIQEHLQKNPKEIEIRHILVAKEEDTKTILDRLAQGESFGKLARQLSLDPTSGEEGGALGFIRRGEWPLEFEKAAFALRIGETSAPVQTGVGWHVIQKINERSVDLAQAKEGIRQFLEREKFEEWVKAQKESVSIRIDEKVLKQAAFPKEGTHEN